MCCRASFKARAQAAAAWLQAQPSPDSGTQLTMGQFYMAESKKLQFRRTQGLAWLV
jgi:hypothetical protein